MSGADQEHIEDYLELETYIEALQAGRVARPPAGMTPAQVRVYRVALLLHTVSSGAGELRPAFAAALQVRLEQALRQAENKPRLLEAGAGRLQKQPRHVSRRALLAGGAAVAASLVVGAGVEHVVEQTHASAAPPALPPTTTSGQNPPLVPASAPSTWHFVTTLTDLRNNAVRFTTDTVVGYVLRTTDGSAAQIIALSAACTHMGCIVHWQQTDRQFHCPCHNGIFAENGIGWNAPGSAHYLSPLPRLKTKVDQGNVYVQVPVSRK